jgi:tetratricopeptide (TPR) repeat protein
VDLLAGRTLTAEARLRRAWELHDPARGALVGVAAATQLVWGNLIGGRLPDAIVWGRRAVDARRRHPSRASSARDARAQLGRGRSREGRAPPPFVSPHRASADALEETDALVIRGVVRLFTEQLADAIADLQTAASRLRAGVPLFDASQCLSHLADAEYRVGAWDGAIIHGELAVSLTNDADRAWGLGFVHGYAAFVPAARGDWRAAGAYVEAAKAAAQALGATTAIVLAATAQAAPATASGDPEDVLRAAATVRAAGHTEVYANLGPYDWLPDKIGAHIALGHWEAAHTALAELETAVSPSSPTWANVTAAHLRGNLAAARGDAAAAADAFTTAFRRADGYSERLVASEAKRFPEGSDHAGGAGISVTAAIEWASFSPHPRARSSSPGLSGPSVPVTRKLSVASTSKPWCRRRRAMPRAAEPVSSGTPSARVSKAAARRPAAERRSPSQERRPGSSVASGSISAPSCAPSTAT